MCGGKRVYGALGAKIEGVIGKGLTLTELNHLVLQYPGALGICQEKVRHLTCHQRHHTFSSSIDTDVNVL